MDDPDVGGPSDLEPRPPKPGDLTALCRALNERAARYVVIGGMAVIHAGYPRVTGDIDLLIDASPVNEARVFAALATLPDQAVRELNPGDVERYSVVRVADEIVVDIMKSACGIGFEEASGEVEYRELDGVRIPLASPRLLWRTKRHTHRAKDEADLVFLRQWFRERGEIPPD